MYRNYINYSGHFLQNPPTSCKLNDVCIEPSRIENMTSSKQFHFFHFLARTRYENILGLYHVLTVAQWLSCCATIRKVAGSIPAGVSGIFHWHKIIPIALWSWGRLSFERKWVPGAFLGGKGGRCVRLTNLPPSCAVVMKAENINFLEPSRPDPGL